MCQLARMCMCKMSECHACWPHVTAWRLLGQRLPKLKKYGILTNYLATQMNCPVQSQVHNFYLLDVHQLDIELEGGVRRDGALDA